jgi:abortive infection bacteriophage resistance protein
VLKKHFNKQALTVSQQLEFLANQGLLISDHEIAEHVLSTIGYYRLSGYLLHDLFTKYEGYPGVPMGFSHNWRLDPIWELEGEQHSPAAVENKFRNISVA